MKRKALLAAMALALAAMALTATSRADVDGNAGSSASPSAPPAGTPLELRPSKPIQLAPESGLGGAAWKVVVLVGLVGAGALFLRNRARPRTLGEGNMMIVRRMAAGFRSELLIVNVEGQRLLIGVTPHNIQTLAVLDMDDSAEVEAASAPSMSTSTVGERFAAMLDTATQSGPSGRLHESAARPKTPERGDEEFSDQARGLLALRRRP